MTDVSDSQSSSCPNCLPVTRGGHMGLSVITWCIVPKLVAAPFKMTSCLAGWVYTHSFLSIQRCSRRSNSWPWSHIVVGCDRKLIMFNHSLINCFTIVYVWRKLMKTQLFHGTFEGNSWKTQLFHHCWTMIQPHYPSPGATVSPNCADRRIRRSAPLSSSALDS